MKQSSYFSLYPVVPLTVSLVLGIVLGHRSCLAVPVWIWLEGMLGLLALSMLFRRYRQVRFYCLHALALLLGIALVGHAERVSTCPPFTTAHSWEGVVLDEPVDKGKTLRTDLFILSGPLKGHKVRAYIQKDRTYGYDSTLQVGRCLSGYSQMRPPRPLSDSHFDYPTYLKARGIVAQTYISADAWCLVRRSLNMVPPVERMKLYALTLRHRLLDRYREVGLVGQGLAVVSAMTLGDKSALTSTLRDTYSMTGTSHILALSGMHLSIIFSLLAFGTRHVRMGLVRSVGCLVAVWFYVFLVGMPVSVVRAALMLTLYMAVTLSGRDATSVNTLAFTALVMLVANPLMLYDIGFQLSFLAVFSIEVLYVAVARAFPGLRRWPCLPRYLANLSLMSTVAQIGTLPLTVYYFGRVSLCFLPANLIVVPAVFLVVYAAVFLLAVSFFRPLALSVSSVVMWLLDTLNRLLSWIASWPGASIGGLHISLSQLLLLYVLLGGIIRVAVLLCGRLSKQREAGLS